MTFVAGTPLSAADLNDALASDSPTTFSTTTPAGTGWYRFLLGGALVEFHYESSDTVASQTEVSPSGLTLPAAYRPASRAPLAAVSNATQRPGAAAINSDGTWSIYNWQNSAQVVACHGIYKPA